MDLNTFSAEELHRLCYLRAIEWLAWPAFVSQPLLPILYLYYPVYIILGVVIGLGVLWLPLRYHFLSLWLADCGCLWVRLKWITIPIGVIILGTQRRYIAAIVAFATPWIAGLLTVPGQVGTVEAKFMSMAGSFGLQERGHWRPD